MIYFSRGWQTQSYYPTLRSMSKQEPRCAKENIETLNLTCMKTSNWKVLEGAGTWPVQSTRGSWLVNVTNINWRTLRKNRVHDPVWDPIVLKIKTKESWQLGKDDGWNNPEYEDVENHSKIRILQFCNFMQHQYGSSVPIIGLHKYS